MDLDDTIAAIASAPGGAVRGIIRVSGPRAIDFVESFVASEAGSLPADCRRPSCRTAIARLAAPLGDVPATAYLWPSGRSYTRQPSAELHLPGSPPILAAALAAVCRAGARVARPGEFTLRAFLAGRLDLTQAEAVLGVIDARSQRELTAALGQLAGGLARPLQALREQLLDLLAHLEAGLDFADEDVDVIAADDLRRALAGAASQVAELANRMESRGEAGRLPRAVLWGLPNVGKSSLLNALAGEAAAIVSPIAGTTRDCVIRRVICAGQEVLLVDTAGALDAALPGIEAAAQAAAIGQQQQADLTLLCLDASRPLTAWEVQQLAEPPSRERLIVATKCDLPSSALYLADAIRVSSWSGRGLAALRAAIGQALAAGPPDARFVAGTAERCRESLRLVAATLERARMAAQQAAGEELVAAELRGALDELGQVVGAVYTEDVLDRIFSRFCIGK